LKFKIIQLINGEIKSMDLNSLEELQSYIDVDFTNGCTNG